MVIRRQISKRKTLKTNKGKTMKKKNKYSQYKKRYSLGKRMRSKRISSYRKKKRTTKKGGFFFKRTRPDIGNYEYYDMKDLLDLVSPDKHIEEAIAAAKEANEKGMYCGVDYNGKYNCLTLAEINAGSTN
jgi:Holliday junction resolvase RusA-like endonuclease